MPPGNGIQLGTKLWKLQVTLCVPRKQKGITLTLVLEECLPY